MRVCIIHRGIGKQEENSFFSLHLYPIFMRAKERKRARWKQGDRKREFYPYPLEGKPSKLLE